MQRLTRQFIVSKKDAEPLSHAIQWKQTNEINDMQPESLANSTKYVNKYFGNKMVTSESIL